MNKKRPSSLWMLALLLTIMMTGCKSQYDSMKYINNSGQMSVIQAPKNNSVILPKDLLTITVSGISNEDLVAVFNVTDNSALNTSSSRVRANSNGELHQYLVDNAGDIQFPLIGKIHVANMSREKAQEVIGNEIQRYFSSEKPIVTITFINYKFTVMGEVKNPGIYNLNMENVTIFDAIARAGDMTIYGKRDCVKLIREDKDGQKSIHVLNLNDAGIMASPYYYLQQNDIVYVEPNKVQAQNAKVGSMTRIWLSFASILVSIGSLMYMILK